ncbi:MAG TPA: alpha-galactosidase, partial [Candidatus Brocadiia bacterium]|nr:alpha-galactosidase [Candidatus Brocadiia bacterium]
RIRSLGYEPGIWTCPFIADLQSELTRHHPGWILKDTAGKPVIFVMGGVDNYTLDTTHPQVLAWLKDLFAGLRRQGYTYHKFDFMRAVAQASRSVLNAELGAGSGPQGANPAFHDPTATRAQAFRRGLAAIHDALGDGAYLLVCGGLYLPAIGLADAQRSGSDVRSRWTQPRADTRVRQNLLRWWMNRLWRQDPDAMMVRRREKPFRENTISLGLFTDEEARTLTVNQYLGGGLVCFTERMSELDSDRAALYRLCIPSLGVESVPADLFVPGRIPSVHTTPVPSPAPGLPSWLTVAVINWLDDSHTFNLRLDKDSLAVAPPPAPFYLVWEYFEERLMGVFQPGQPLPPLTVPAHGARVLRVTPWDGATIALAGANRHLSMGGVEIARWTPTPGGVDVDVASPWPGEFNLWFALPGQPQPRIVQRPASNGQRLHLQV